MRIVLFSDESKIESDQHDRMFGWRQVGEDWLRTMYYSPS